MQLLTEQEIDLVSGGEVGATGMGDDWHYTGDPKKDPDATKPRDEGKSKPDAVLAWLRCINGEPQGCVDVFWIALGQ